MDAEDNNLVNNGKVEIKITQTQSSDQNSRRNVDDQSKLTFFDLIPQIFASCMVYLLVVQAGISMSFSSVLITQLSDSREIEVNSESASIIASIWSIALPIGALLSGYFMDRFGRRKTALFICFPFTFSWILTSTAKNISMIYMARIILGISTGLTTACVVYVAEISSKYTRSGLLCMNSVWVSFGIFSTFLLHFFEFNWKMIGFIYATLSFFCFIAIYFVPESPHWLFMLNSKASENQRQKQLRSSLQWIYRKNKISESHFEEFVQAKNLTNEANLNETRFKHLLDPRVYKPLFLLFVLFLLQQCCGGYILIFYALIIIRNLSVDFSSTINERLALVLVGLIRLVMAILAASLAQKCNRKTLLYISTVGMGIFAFIAANQMMHADNSAAQSFFYKQANTTTTDEISSGAGNYILLACVLCYILFASIGILIVPWTLISELFSVKFKAKFGGLSVAIAYVLMSIFLKYFPLAMEFCSISQIFTFFGFSSFVTAIFVYFFIPETHKKSFADIEKYFHNG